MSVYADKMLDLRNKREHVRKWSRRIKDSGMSREAWAALHGYDPSQLSQWINEKQVPTWTTISAIDDLLQSEKTPRPRRKESVGKFVEKRRGKPVRR